jgi:hypothetical protein
MPPDVKKAETWILTKKHRSLHKMTIPADILIWTKIGGFQFDYVYFLSTLALRP